MYKNNSSISPEFVQLYKVQLFVQYLLTNSRNCGIIIMYSQQVERLKANNTLERVALGWGSTLSKVLLCYLVGDRSTVADRKGASAKANTPVRSFPSERLSKSYAFGEALITSGSLQFSFKGTAAKLRLRRSADHKRASSVLLQRHSREITPWE